MAITVRVYDRENGEEETYIENKNLCKQFSSETEAKSYVKECAFSELCMAEGHYERYENGCSIDFYADKDGKSFTSQFSDNKYPDFHETRYSVFSEDGQQIAVDWTDIIEWANSKEWKESYETSKTTEEPDLE